MFLSPDSIPMRLPLLNREYLRLKAVCNPLSAFLKRLCYRCCRALQAPSPMGLYRRLRHRSAVFRLLSGFSLDEGFALRAAVLLFAGFLPPVRKGSPPNAIENTLKNPPIALIILTGNISISIARLLFCFVGTYFLRM